MLLELNDYKEILKNKYDQSDSPRKEARYIHSLSVGKKAKEIVQRFNFDLDLKKVEIAGILHDYAKFESMDKFREIVQEYKLDEDILNENFKILHALLGPYVIHKEVGIDDLEILNAIKYHATGSLDMDRYAEVIYVADVAEDLRASEGFDKIKEYALTDFKKAILEKIQFTLEKNDTEFNRKLLKKYLEE